MFEDCETGFSLLLKYTFMLRHLNSISKRIPVYVIGKTLAGAH